MPTVIVGSLLKGSPTFITVCYIGIVQHKPPMVSITLTNKHVTPRCIKENKTFSINIPDTSMLEITDFIGMHSGDTVDKSLLFSVFYGELKNAPMIRETPLNLECRLVDIISMKSESEIFIGEIIQTYSSKKYISKDYPDIQKLDPILFSINSNRYFKVGRKIGYAWKSGLKINAARYRRNKD